MDTIFLCAKDVKQLTWLALGHDHLGGSGSAEQVTALSDVCDSDRCRDAVAYSRISGRGNRRLRAVPNNISTDFSSQQVSLSFHEIDNFQK